ARGGARGAGGGDPVAMVERRARGPRRGPSGRGGAARNHRALSAAAGAISDLAPGAPGWSLRRSDVQPGRFLNLCGGRLGGGFDVVGPGFPAGIDPGALTRHAGLAHAIAGLLAAFAIHAARGQLFVPLDILTRHGATPEDVAGGQATPQLRAALAELRAHARQHLGEAQRLLAAAPAAVMPALLPVALAGPMLARMERRGYDPFTPVELAPWRRQLIIWRAAKQPGRIFR